MGGEAENQFYIEIWLVMAHTYTQLNITKPELLVVCRMRLDGSEYVSSLKLMVQELTIRMANSISLTVAQAKIITLNMLL